MRSKLFLTLALIGLAINIACTNAAGPPVVVKSSPTPAATAVPAATHDHTQELNAPRISLADAKKEYDAGTALIVDVRDSGAYKVEHVKGSLNITQWELDAKADKLPKGKKIIAYCS